MIFFVHHLAYYGLNKYKSLGKEIFKIFFCLNALMMSVMESCSGFEHV